MESREVRWPRSENPGAGGASKLGGAWAGSEESWGLTAVGDLLLPWNAHLKVAHVFWDPLGYIFSQMCHTPLFTGNTHKELLPELSQMLQGVEFNRLSNHFVWQKPEASFSTEVHIQVIDLTSQTPGLTREGCNSCCSWCNPFFLPSLSYSRDRLLRESHMGDHLKIHKSSVMITSS